MFVASAMFCGFCSLSLLAVCCACCVLCFFFLHGILCLLWSVLCLSRAVCAVCCLLFVSMLIVLSGVDCHLCCLFIFGVVSLASLSVVIILHHHQYQHSSPFFFSNRGITLRKGLQRHEAVYVVCIFARGMSITFHSIPEQSAIWPDFFNCLCPFKSSPSICPVNPSRTSKKLHAGARQGLLNATMAKLP